MRVIAASPSVASVKLFTVKASSNRRHFRPSEQNADDIKRLAKYDFLLVFYRAVSIWVDRGKAIEVSRP